jgi:hypothetical protein
MGAVRPRFALAALGVSGLGASAEAALLRE